jgi:hypothetical protein
MVTGSRPLAGKVSTGSPSKATARSGRASREGHQPALQEPVGSRPRDRLLAARRDARTVWENGRRLGKPEDHQVRGQARELTRIAGGGERAQLPPEGLGASQQPVTPFRAPVRTPSPQPAAPRGVTADLCPDPFQHRNKLRATLREPHRGPPGEQAVEKRCLIPQQPALIGCLAAQIGQRPVGLIPARHLSQPQIATLSKIGHRRPDMTQDDPADDHHAQLCRPQTVGRQQGGSAVFGHLQIIRPPRNPPAEFITICAEPPAVHQAHDGEQNGAPTLAPRSDRPSHPRPPGPQDHRMKNAHCHSASGPLITARLPAVLDGLQAGLVGLRIAHITVDLRGWFGWEPLDDHGGARTWASLASRVRRHGASE